MENFRPTGKPNRMRPRSVVRLFVPSCFTYLLKLGTVPTDWASKTLIQHIERRQQRRSMCELFADGGAAHWLPCY